MGCMCKLKGMDRCLLELALAISLISLGSNQTFFLPHRITEEASLFCNLRELKPKQIHIISKNVERFRKVSKHECQQDPAARTQ